jgi:HAD superfamily hydrolase (TIGR01509 family)
MIVRGEPAPMYDLMGKDATMFHHERGDDHASIGGQYVDQAQAWSDGMWATVSTQRRPTRRMTSPHRELAQLASQTRHVLIGFGGPVCDIFTGMPDHVLADKLRSELRAAGIDIPPSAATVWDPLELFRAVADLGDAAAATAQELLTRLEVEAAATARPAPGSADLITAASQTGRTVTVVTNNSGAAVAAYPARQHLASLVGKVIGRDDPDPALMKPSPYRVRIAVGSLNAEPGECVFIGDSESDVIAGLLGGVAVIGYANKSGKTETLSQARAVVTDQSEITTALRTVPVLHCRIEPY